MLEVLIDDADSPDAVAHPRHRGSQTAGAPHDEAHFDPFACGPVEPLDGPFVGQRVALGVDVGPAPLAGVARLAVDKLLEGLAHVVGRHEQVLVLELLVAVGEELEDVAHILDDALVGGQQTEITVDARRILVEVARSDVGIAPHAGALAPLDQDDFAVYLQVLDGIDDLDPLALQQVGVLDVLLLVEARLQLDEHRDLLAVFGGVDQRVDDLRVLGRAVERDGNPLDPGVDGRLAQEVDEVLERVVGEIEEDVALAHHLQDALEGDDVAVLQLCRIDRQQVGAHLREAHQVFHQVVAVARCKRSGSRQLQLAGQHVEQVDGHLAVVYQPDRQPVAAALDPLGNPLEEALRDVIVNRELGVAHDFEGMDRDVVVGEHEEDVVNHQPDDVVEEDNLAPPLARGKHHEARAGRADRYPNHGVARRLAVVRGHADPQVGVAVGQEGNPDRLAEHERHEPRRDDRGEVVAAELPLFGREVSLVDDEDALLLHLVQQLVVGLREEPLGALGAAAHLGQQLGRRITARETLLPPGAAEPHEVGDADLEELVLVVGEDAEELQPRKQRHASVLRLLQHPFVEGEPAQLAVVVCEIHITHRWWNQCVSNSMKRSSAESTQARKRSSPVAAPRRAR